MPSPSRRRPRNALGERIKLPDGKTALLFTKAEYESLKAPFPTRQQIIFSGNKGIILVERRGAKALLEKKTGKKPVQYRAPGEKPLSQGKKGQRLPVQREPWRLQQSADLVERLRKTGWTEADIRAFLESRGYPWPE